MPRYHPNFTRIVYDKPTSELGVPPLIDNPSEMVGFIIDNHPSMGFIIDNPFETPIFFCF